jgi:putative ABC transport system permease protein
MASLPTVARFVKEARPNAYYLKFGSDLNLAQLKQYLTPHPDADLNLILVEQAIPGSVIYLQAAIFMLSLVVIGIALVNVFNTSLLTVQEKLRAIGVLKTLGMTPRQVVAMVNTSAGFLGLVATGFGTPIGLAFTKGLLTTLSAGYGFGEAQVTLDLFYVLLLVPLIVGVSILGSYIPGQQAAKLSIVQVLRNE